MTPIHCRLLFPALALVAVIAPAIGVAAAADAPSGGLRMGSFIVDVTPPLGSPLCYGNVKPAVEVVDPLTARGIVLLGAGEPIVLCVADFVGINNESNDRWRSALAEAANTSVKRVAMHVIHNHDSPGYDISAERMLIEQGLGNTTFDAGAHDAAIERAAKALREAVAAAQPIDRIGLGTGTVKKFASNRRLIGDDGKIAMVRLSSGGRKPEAAAAPEGVIDPEVSLVTFWNGEQAVAAMTFYASHPQSYYNRGGITPDTVGLARNLLQEETGVPHLHFDGAGGDVAAGKYNDGKPERRQELTDRLAAGMRSAWEAQTMVDIKAADVDWKVVSASLPWSGRYTEEQLHAEVTNPEVSLLKRRRAARDLVFLRRWKEGREIDLPRLRLGAAWLLFYPGELFVEYQLKAKQARPEDFVAVAAYGDGGIGYIGTAIAYEQGGYEVGRVSLTGPKAEDVLHQATRELLRP
jgi:hypothetical protein